MLSPSSAQIAPEFREPSSFIKIERIDQDQGQKNTIKFGSAAVGLTCAERCMLSVHRYWLVASLLLSPLHTFTADAQQITGVPGSPSATVTIDGKQLPPPSMLINGQ